MLERARDCTAASWALAIGAHLELLVEPFLLKLAVPDPREALWPGGSHLQRQAVPKRAPRWPEEANGRPL
jgi:hypothetical protein